MTATCVSCGAPILWAVTDKGKRIPLDLEPVPLGNVAVSADSGFPSAPPMAKVWGNRHEWPPRKPRYVSHFSTCPHAKEHRHK